MSADAANADPSPSRPPLPPPAKPSGGTFRALRHRNYRLYFIGQLFSLTGSFVQTTALMWLAFEMTGESKWPALVAAAQGIPTFLLGVWGGNLADRWPKRSLIFLTQSAFLVLALLLAVLVLVDAATPWHLLAVAAAVGAVNAVDLPARLAFVVDLTGREDLINGVALNSLLFNVARAVGPAVGGVLLIEWGAGYCFLINGLSYVAVLVALARMDVSGSVGTPDEHSGWRSALAGFAYLAGRPRLALLLALAGLMALCGWPFLSLLPGLAGRVLGEDKQGYGWMLSGTGFGALTAALTIASFGSLARRRLFIAAGVGVTTVALLGLSLATNLFAAMGCCALTGFGLILFFATGQSVVQLSAGESNRGRLMGIWAMTLFGAVPLGNSLAGPAADLWTEPVVLRLEALACALAAIVVLALRGLVPESAAVTRDLST